MWFWWTKCGYIKQSMSFNVQNTDSFIYIKYGGNSFNSLQLDEQENKAVFGKCNNPNGHGHNYKGTIIF